MFPVIAWFINRRSRLTGIATGDQDCSSRAAPSRGHGEFPDQPLMEDVEFCKRARRVSHPLVSRCAFKRPAAAGKNGVFKTIVLMWVLRARYFLGEAPESLHRAYYEKSPPHDRNTGHRLRQGPIPGEVKTRLAPAIGDMNAALLHSALTERAIENAQSLGSTVELCCAPDINMRSSNNARRISA